VVPVLVPSASGGTRVTAENQFELGERRVTGEIFVREYIEISRMIYRKKTHFVEINNFLQRLHEPETEDWVHHFSPISGAVGMIFVMKPVAMNFPSLRRAWNT